MSSILENSKFYKYIKMNWGFKNWGRWYVYLSSAELEKKEHIVF